MTNQRPRVFILEEGRQDSSPAAAHGEPVVLFGAHRHRSSIFDAVLYQHELHEALADHDYDPAHDFIVVSGYQNLITLAVASLVATHGDIKLLLFDATSRSYRPFPVHRKETTPCCPPLPTSTPMPATPTQGSSQSS